MIWNWGIGYAWYNSRKHRYSICDCYTWKGVHWRSLVWHIFAVPFLMPSLVAQRLKRLPAMRETWVLSLGREDPLEKETATQPSILAWRIPWMEEPGGLQSTGSQRVGHNWATSRRLDAHNELNNQGAHQTDWFSYLNLFLFVMPHFS